MSKFVHVCELNQLGDGGMRTIVADGVQIVVARDGDTLYALKDECSHEEFPLSEGWIEDGCLFCAFHGAKFDLKSGEALTLPAYEGVKTYPVRVNDGMIEVNVRDGEPLERALRRFKKKWERAGVLRDVRRKSFYVKPSVEKRESRKKAVRRMARFERIRKLYE